MTSPYTQSYVSWGAVLAGAVVATAISGVMLQFGSAVGLANTDQLTSNLAAVSAGGVLAIGIWLLWVQLMASIIGGYIAGRLRQPVENASSHESEVRDGAHGLLVWATGTVAVFAAAGLAAAVAALAPTTNAMVTGTSPELEKTVSVIFAFAMGATSLVSAVASWFAATKGGDHRDSGVDLSKYLSFKH